MAQHLVNVAENDVGVARRDDLLTVSHVDEMTDSEPFAPPRTATEEIFGESDSSDEEVPETTPAQDYYYI